MGVPAEKILTLFNPVDVQWFADLAAKDRVASSPGHRFLYVGQLIERKNVEMLVDAFAAMRNPRDSLTIVGDGPLSATLQEYSRRLGLDGSVHFTGHHDQQQVAHDYANADTLVLPSTNEVWGLVVNEALASGLHVAVSKAAGVASFVEPMTGAYLFDPEISSMITALRRSREDWNGVITNPEIMRYTPEKFAEAIVGVVETI
jgi:glycosyltransferase involved in cell wall biosynthesis